MKKLSLEKIGFYASILLAALLCFSARGKLMLVDGVMQIFVNDLADWRVIIALGEIASAILFALPKTKRIGTWLLSSYFGGAILLHMTTGDSILVPVVLLLIIWTLAVLRGEKLVN